MPKLVVGFNPDEYTESLRHAHEDKGIALTDLVRTSLLYLMETGHSIDEDFFPVLESPDGTRQKHIVLPYFPTPKFIA